MTTSSEATTIPNQAERFGTWGAALLAVLALAWLQFSFADLFDLDSYFHARAGLELLETGVQTTFPQATFSTWADSYSDKDFLFHLLIAPLVSNPDLLPGAKWAVILLDLALMLAMAFAVRSLGLRFGAVWVLLLIAASPYYVTRMVPLRPQILGLAFLTIELALLVRGRWKTLFPVSFLHVLTHSSFPLALGLWGMWFVVAAIRRDPLPLRTGGAILAGLALALLVHPYFPNNLQIAYAQILQLAGHLWGTASEIPKNAFGNELRPMATRTFWLTAPAWLPALLGLAATLVHRGLRSWPARDLFLLLATLAFLALAFAARRFVDIFILSAALLAGGLWTTLAGGKTLRTLLSNSPLGAGTAITAILACLLSGLGLVWTDLPERFAKQAYGGIYKPAVEQLDTLAAPGDVVYHPSWQEFSILYGFRPDGRYISGLDPVYLYEKNPQLFRKNWQLSRGRGKAAYRILTSGFGARWAFIPKRKRYAKLQVRLAKNPNIQLVWHDDAASLWFIPSPGRPGS